MGWSDIARIDAEEAHTDSSVPRRGPEEADAALIVGLAGVEVAGQGGMKSGLEVGIATAI